MASAQEQVTTTRVSYWQVFRLIFVMFSLYLMGDAFYRWDGFRYYASFSEFLPGVALVTILWSIVAVFTAILVWLPLRGLEWSCLRIGWKVRAENWLFFICVFSSLGVIAWVGKRLMWGAMALTSQEKWVISLGMFLGSIFLTWLFRNKLEKALGTIQERITPLVWLFGIWAIISVSLVVYHAWGKEPDKILSQKFPQSSLADKARPNIILVTFDALTARDMSVYGYRRLTTPFISKWAKEASVFTKVEAESNYTSPTTASLMTGKRVWTHQLYHSHGSKPVKSDIESLPLLLKKDGYYTMAFIVNGLASVKTLGISNSFEIAPSPSDFMIPASLEGIVNQSLYRLFGDKIQLHDWIMKRDFILYKFFLKVIFHNFSEFSTTEVPPEKAFNGFLEVMKNNPPKPFFAWIHVLPPHNPYLPPEPYMGMFDSSSGARTFKSQLKAFKSQYLLPEMQPTINILRARYDEFIRYCNEQFEYFIAQLIIRKKLKNTVVILSSDHGESFGHDYLLHSGPHLYEQITHIPLIIKEPDQTDGRIINDLVEQIDISPTILELAKIPVPSWMEGRSLVSFMRGKRLPSRPAFSMNFQTNPSRGHQITKGTIAVWEGDYKLIHYLEEKKSLLFNLRKDPDELSNLFDKEPDVGQRLLTLIQANLKKANERISSEKHLNN